MFNLTNGINRDFTNNSITKGESIMGYRSDVTYAILFRELSCKRKFVAIAKLNPQFNEALKECEHVDDDKLFIYADFNYVKWYDEDEDVQCHMQMLDSISTNELDGVSAKFVRMGEENDDIEEMVFEGEDCPNGWSIHVGVSRHVYNEYAKRGD